ncbi:hypothetical protein GGR57DRAFT_487262 [Xylariaceae sp. FL1272]|nr:hypothetical protein GGR57DRAFT_487262 [Xylariaceae sp. FL1272]
MRDQSLGQVFFVSKEARQAALSAYRVQIPCWSTTSQMPKTVYFCPERDFVQLRGDPSLVPQFLHDLKTIHDPRHVGILNLAIGEDVLDKADDMPASPNSGPFSTNPSLAQSFRATMRQLRQIFFIHEAEWVDRRVLSSRHSIGMGDLDLLNTSRPVEAEVPGFNMIGADPRDISRHLKRFRLLSPPGRLITAWEKYLRRYIGPDNDGIAPTTQCRILLTSPPRSFFTERGGLGYHPHELLEMPGSLSSLDGWDVRSHETARLVLQAETEMLMTDRQAAFQQDKVDGVVEATAEFSTSLPYSGCVDVVGSPMNAAFGFWLFPIAAFANHPPPNDDGFYFFPGRHGIDVDLSEYWPELALMDL